MSERDELMADLARLSANGRTSEVRAIACAARNLLERDGAEIARLRVEREREERECGEVLATITTPRSISFASMDDAEFHAFFDRCVGVICTQMVPGLDDVVLREEVLRAVG